MTLTNIVGIIIAIIIIISTLYFFLKMGSLFMPDPGQKSKASLRRFGIMINEMKPGDYKEFTLFLDEDYYMIGYMGKYFKKPSKCMQRNKDCLCVCDDNNCEGEVVDCVGFSDISFYSNTALTNVFLHIDSENVVGWNKGLLKLYLCRFKDVSTLSIFTEDYFNDVSSLKDFEEKELCSGEPNWNEINRYAGAQARPATPDKKGDIVLNVPSGPSRTPEEQG